MSSNLLSGFNNHFEEFLDSVYGVLPEDADVLASKNILNQIRKANPKMIIKIWKTYIVDNYYSEIEGGDISFFIEKDYSQDLQKMDAANKILEGINRLRSPIKNMGESNQKIAMKYIQNLSKIAKVYFSGQ